MCSSSKNKLGSIMEGKFQNHAFCDCSRLLELAALGDVESFRKEVEEKGADVDGSCFWYGRVIGSKKMGFEERTPLMIASMFGNAKVVNYIIQTGKADVNRACGSDRVTALHCAVSGGSVSSLDTVKLLLAASSDVDCLIDLVGLDSKFPLNSRKALEMLLKGDDSGEVEWSLKLESEKRSIVKEGSEKKGFPVDISLPDINCGLYGTDDFRMYTFKVKPCSRAYSHDWTECPFVHPGENARRRDPRKYPYSCVPCPDFRKGTCEKGDSCEYAHGVFESWLHPAQYRTRLCKDEIGCARKVCFFAHKPEDLRPVYASTGSALPSNRPLSVSAVDMAMLSPSALGASSFSLPTTSPPLSPLAATSSPKSGISWQNKVNFTPPILQLPGSRLKSTMSARDLNLEMELLGIKTRPSQHQNQQLMDEISRLSSPNYWSKDLSRIGDLKPTNFNDASIDSALSQFQGLPLTPTQLLSSTGLQMHQNGSQLRQYYPTNLSSSPVRKPTSFGHESGSAAPVMGSRSTAFTKRSQSFVERSATTHLPDFLGSSNSKAVMASNLSGWSSPDGKLNWAVKEEELHKLKKSASFGIRNSITGTTNATSITRSEYEPDVSWVNSMVKDVPPERSTLFAVQNYPRFNNDGTLASWVEQLYTEQEQVVA